MAATGDGDVDEDEDDKYDDDGLVEFALTRPSDVPDRAVRYHDCAGLSVGERSALLRECLAASRPAVLGGCVSHWPALRRWRDVRYLVDRVGTASVHVARTPDGLADAVAALPSGERVFARPDETPMAFADFASQLVTPLHDSSGRQRRAVLYASHQNSSLQTEFEALWGDTELALAWADAAVGQPPAAANFWMGEDAARTSVHADLYDNLYVVVVGEKRFSLLPPMEGPRLGRRPFRAATWRPAEPAQAVEDCTAGLALHLDSPEACVHWADLDLEADDATQELQPLRVTVRAGELLVLPALWWHAVSQRADAASGCPATVAVNYWYDSQL